jgi:hypothetical protein
VLDLPHTLAARADGYFVEEAWASRKSAGRRRFLPARAAGSIDRHERSMAMPSFTEEIKKYDVAIYGGGKNTTGYPYRAIIGLRRNDNSLIGGAYFHRDPATMPNTDEQNAAGYLYCHYPWDAFPQVMDLLRNEEPIIVRYVAGGWQIASITTSIEPIGENEQP